MKVKGKLVGKVLAAFEGLIWNQAEKDGNVEIELPPVNVADLKEGDTVLFRGTYCKGEDCEFIIATNRDIVYILPQEGKKVQDKRCNINPSHNVCDCISLFWARTCDYYKDGFCEIYKINKEKESPKSID